jgi:hypothetical protein
LNIRYRWLTRAIFKKIDTEVSIGLRPTNRLAIMFRGRLVQVETNGSLMKGSK